MGPSVVRVYYIIARKCTRIIMSHIRDTCLRTLIMRVTYSCIGLRKLITRVTNSLQRSSMGQGGYLMTSQYYSLFEFA